MSNTPKRPVTRSVEIAVVELLKQSGAFNGCGIIAKGESQEAPSKLPCIIVHCPSAPRHGDVIGFYPRDAEVVATLYVDSEQTTQAQCEKLARDMENILDWKAGLQKQFNKPESGPDPRKVRGVYFHEIIDFGTESDTDGTMWMRSATATLVVQEIDE